MSAAHGATAADLPRFQDKSFIEALTNTGVIGTKAIGGAAVRVLLKWENGECDPGREAETCPHSQLLVLVINEPGDVRPDVKVWSTERKIHWQIVRWLDATDSGKVSFEASVCEPAPRAGAEDAKQPAGGVWRERPYRIDVGLEATSITALTDKATGIQCQFY